jgi:DNA-binding transcriptional MerR regulator
MMSILRGMGAEKMSYENITEDAQAETAAGGGDTAAGGISVGKKMYYSISEVCRMTGLEAHVLRYWEAEISKLRPKKNRSGNRAYREKDIGLILQIKRLLHEENYTIHGIKHKLIVERRAELLEKQRAKGRDDENWLARLTGERAETPLDGPAGDRQPEPERPAHTTRPATAQDAPPPPDPDSGLIPSVRDELREVLAILES